MLRYLEIGDRLYREQMESYKALYIFMKRGALSFLTSAKFFLSLGAFSASLLASESAFLPEAEFPLGRIELPEKRTETVIRPGVTYIHVERGQPLLGDHWAILASNLIDKSVVDSLKADLQKTGLRVQVDWFQGPLEGKRYWFLSAGDFSSRAEATEVLARLTCGGPLQVRHRASLPSWATGPWTFDIVIIDPGKYEGRIISARESGLVSTSEIARKHQAVVGINASFFEGYARPDFPAIELPGSAGTSIIQGQWYNEPDDGPVVFIENGEAGPTLWVEQPHASIPAPRIKWADGKTVPLTGINRALRAANELIAMRPEIFEYWQKVKAIPTEPLFVRVTKNGDLARFSQAQELSPEDLVLLGTDCWRERLEAALASSERVEVSLGIPGHPELNAFRGVPILIHDGNVVYLDRREGRTARTAVGVDAAGKIYLVTVDGNRYEPPTDGRLGSVGASISEVREIMRFLGAVDAVNLDGGGSSVMVIDGEVVSHPYDRLPPKGHRSVERAVLDALLLVD